MGKWLEQLATTLFLCLVLLLILVRCSAEDLETLAAATSESSEVTLELSALNLNDISTQDLGICVVEFRIYPNDVDSQIVRVPVEMSEIQYTETGVPLGTIRSVPGNSYYLVELVLRNNCETSSVRFSNGEYYSSSEEIVLRFRGNIGLGYQKATLSLNLLSHLSALDGVSQPSDVKKFLHAAEGSF